MKLSYYKTNIGLFIRFSNRGRNCSFENSHLRLNRTITNAPKNGDYYYFADVHSIDVVEMRKPNRSVHVGFKLKDNVPGSIAATLEPYYTVKETGYSWGANGEDDYGFSPEFAPISSLYEPVYEQEDSGWGEIKVDHEVLGELEISNYRKPESMVVNWQRNPGIDGKTIDLSAIVQYSDIETMLTPEFMLHTRPCSLTGDQVYKIVRTHILENIDGKYARVTSDYDFCFEVKKVVKIKPITTRREVLTEREKRYKTPKFKTDVVTSKEIPIFEMTTPSRKYGTYTPIEGWQADNLEDMATQVKVYLDALMEEINRPLEECPNCGGVGHVVSCTLGTNKREI